MSSERLWIDPVTGDWGFHSEGPKVLRVEPTAAQQRTWADRGQCVYCGIHNDGQRCRCRECSSCSSIWIADTLAEYADTDHGPKPRLEYCPECIAAKCVTCGLSACHDVHDPRGEIVGAHSFNDGVCTAMVLYNPRFKFDWGYLADCSEQALINECRKLGARMQETTRLIQEMTAEVNALNRDLAA